MRGVFLKLERGDVSDCRHSVSGSMAKQMVFFDLVHRIGLYTGQIDS